MIAKINKINKIIVEINNILNSWGKYCSVFDILVLPLDMQQLVVDKLGSTVGVYKAKKHLSDNDAHMGNLQILHQQLSTPQGDTRRILRGPLFVVLEEFCEANPELASISVTLQLIREKDEEALRVKLLKKKEDAKVLLAEIKDTISEHKPDSLSRKYKRLLLCCVK